MTFNFNPSMNWKDTGGLTPQFIGLPPSGLYNQGSGVAPMNSGYFLPTHGAEYASGVLINGSTLTKNADLRFAWIGIDVRYDNTTNAIKHFFNIDSTGIIPSSIYDYFYYNISGLTPNSGNFGIQDYYYGKYCVSYDSDGYYDLNNYTFHTTQLNSGCIPAILFKRRYKEYNDKLDIELIVSTKIGSYLNKYTYDINNLSLKFIYDGNLHTQLLYKELYEEYIVENELDNYFTSPEKIYKTPLPINPVVTLNSPFFTRHPLHIRDIGSKINIQNCILNYAYQDYKTKILSTTQPAQTPGIDAGATYLKLQLAEGECTTLCYCPTCTTQDVRVQKFTNIDSRMYDNGADIEEIQQNYYHGSQSVNGYINISDFTNQAAFIYDGFLLQNTIFRGDIFYITVRSNFVQNEYDTWRLQSAPAHNQSENNFFAMIDKLEDDGITTDCVIYSVVCASPGVASCLNENGANQNTVEFPYDAFYMLGMISSFGASNKQVQTQYYKFDHHLLYSFVFDYISGDSKIKIHTVGGNNQNNELREYFNYPVNLAEYVAGQPISFSGLNTGQAKTWWYDFTTGPFGMGPALSKPYTILSDAMYDVEILSNLTQDSNDGFYDFTTTTDVEERCDLIYGYQCTIVKNDITRTEPIIKTRYSKYLDYRISMPSPYKRYDSFNDTLRDYIKPPKSKLITYPNVESFTGRRYYRLFSNNFYLNSKVYTYNPSRLGNCYAYTLEPIECTHYYVSLIRTNYINDVQTSAINYRGVDANSVSIEWSI